MPSAVRAAIGFFIPAASAHASSESATGPSAHAARTAESTARTSDSVGFAPSMKKRCVRTSA